MNSDTIGIPRFGPGGYYLTGVLFTQYFTDDGASLHYNYWSSNWGLSSTARKNATAVACHSSRPKWAWGLTSMERRTKASPSARRRWASSSPSHAGRELPWIRNVPRLA